MSILVCMLVLSSLANLSCCSANNILDRYRRFSCVHNNAYTCFYSETARKSLLAFFIDRELEPSDTDDAELVLEKV